MSLSIYCIDTAVAKSKNIGEDEAGTLILTTAPTDTVTANCCASPATAVSNSIASHKASKARCVALWL